MPVFNFFHYSPQHGLTLNETGPLVAVEIGVPAALKQHLAAGGLAIPAPVSDFALVDTGAFATAVDESVFAAIGVPPMDKIPTDTPHGAGTSNVYPSKRQFSWHERNRPADGARGGLHAEMEDEGR